MVVTKLNGLHCALLFCDMRDQPAADDEINFIKDPLIAQALLGITKAHMCPHMVQYVPDEKRPKKKYTGSANQIGRLRLLYPQSA